MRNQPAKKSAMRLAMRTIVIAGLMLPLIEARASAGTFSLRQSSSAALTFNGVEAIAQPGPCTAPYTDHEAGTTVCSVYAGTVTGIAAGGGSAPALINMTILGLDSVNSNPGCFGVYLNVQFAGTADSQTLYGFGSLCGAAGSSPPVQSGAKLSGSGGYGIALSQAGASGIGSFSGRLTPERGVAGDSLVMTFSTAAAALSQ
jgi:hypothetical protein